MCRYDKREEAQEAISALYNVIPDGGTQPLHIRLTEEFNGSFYCNKNNVNSRRVSDFLSSMSKDYLSSDYNGTRNDLLGRNNFHRTANPYASQGNGVVSRGSLGFSSFGPGSFRSGSALSLTSGSMYGSHCNYLESPQQPYYSSNATGLQMYRAGYTGSLNRGMLIFICILLYNL